VVGMTNERLRAALLQSGQTENTLADALGVDPKTVERWIGGRVPYRRTRYQLAQLLKSDDAYLWPSAVSPEQLASASDSEIVTTYSHRWAMPRDAFHALFDSAEEEIGILLFAGVFLFEDAGLLAILRGKADAGVRVRILLGDPDSAEVRDRGDDEGIDDALAGKVRNAIVLLKKLKDVDGIEIRLHATTLYNSIYWADEDLLVNPHIYGAPAADAPVLHLRRVIGGSMVSTYLESFERVWASARPLTTEA
jgi:transcriptional regulator with XRE-family HTH domain